MKRILSFSLLALFIGLVASAASQIHYTGTIGTKKAAITVTVGDQVNTIEYYYLEQGADSKATATAKGEYADFTASQTKEGKPVTTWKCSLSDDLTTLTGWVTDEAAHKRMYINMVKTAQ